MGLEHPDLQPMTTWTDPRNLPANIPVTWANIFLAFGGTIDAEQVTDGHLAMLNVRIRITTTEVRWAFPLFRYEGLTALNLDRDLTQAVDRTCHEILLADLPGFYGAMAGAIINNPTIPTPIL